MADGGIPLVTTSKEFGESPVMEVECVTDEFSSSPPLEVSQSST